MLNSWSECRGYTVSVIFLITLWIRQGLYFITFGVRHSAPTKWGSFLQACGPAAHYTFCELVLILCYIPLHSPGSVKLISVNIKHPKRSREITCTSADKSLCLMEASSYRKSCDSQAKLLWLMPLKYFFIFPLRQNWRGKKISFRHVYLLMEYFTALLTISTCKTILSAYLLAIKVSHWLRWVTNLK